MNRKFVFGDKTRPPLKQLPAFVLVTITGSLLILNLVYILCLKIINGHESLIIQPVETLTGIVLSKSFVDINISTAVGAVVAMFWNYNGYRLFVFKGNGKDAVEPLENTI